MAGIKLCIEIARERWADVWNDWTPAMRAAAVIYIEVTDRRGCSFDGVDEEIILEMIEAWAEAIERLSYAR